MVRRAPKITHGGHFVDHVDLGTLRRQESERALGLLGIKATHVGLPDGKLHLDEHQAVLVEHIVAKVRQENITAMATLGLNGYCGHDDHIAAHTAAVMAQQQLAAEDGSRVAILALNHEHQGALQIPVDPRQKLAALAMHVSQFGPIGEHGGTSLAYSRYQPLFHSETYDLM